MEYMSQEGFDKIAKELHHLETVELPQVKDAISEARDKGDLSENFEYHAAKREQGRLMGRARFLREDTGKRTRDRQICAEERHCGTTEQSEDYQRGSRKEHGLHHRKPTRS